MRTRHTHLRRKYSECGILFLFLSFFLPLAWGADEPPIAQSATFQNEKMVYELTSFHLVNWRARMTVVQPAQKRIRVRMQTQHKEPDGTLREVEFSFVYHVGSLLTERCRMDSRWAGTTHFSAVSDFLGTKVHKVFQQINQRDFPQDYVYVSEPRDPFGALLAIRALAALLMPGQELEMLMVNCMTGYQKENPVYRLRAELVGQRRQQMTRLGPMAVLLFDLHAIPTKLDGTPTGQKELTATLMLSDDSQHRPVRLSGRLGFIDATLDLVYYEPFSPELPPYRGLLPGVSCRDATTGQPCQWPIQSGRH